ncbi:MAG: hypothetical protein R2767_00285 [Chitinophagales bacterium]|nr:hypothetical protein [Chitinophagales bacterium]
MKELKSWLILVFDLFLVVMPVEIYYLTAPDPGLPDSCLRLYPSSQSYVIKEMDSVKSFLKNTEDDRLYEMMITEGLGLKNNLRRYTYLSVYDDHVVINRIENGRSNGNINIKDRDCVKQAKALFVESYSIPRDTIGNYVGGEWEFIFLKDPKYDSCVYDIPIATPDISGELPDHVKRYTDRIYALIQSVCRYGGFFWDPKYVYGVDNE